MIACRPEELISADENKTGARSDSTASPVSARPLIFLHWLIILLVAVVTTRAIWAPALLWGHSAWFDFVRMVEFDAAIRAGDFWPAWSPELYRGYGSPLFQFYAPLAYFLAEIPLRLGLAIPAALKVTELLLLFASGIAMYQLASAHVSRWAACLGAVFYMVAPYRATDLLVRHALAEHASFLWLPLLVWGLERFLTKPSRRSFLVGAIATAGLLLTHNIMAMIGLPFCLAAGWFLSASRKTGRTLLLASLPVTLGLGLAAFFWWPALSGREFTQAQVSLTSGYFDFHRHFINGWLGADVLLQIGWLHLFAGFGTLLLLFGKWRTRWASVGLGILALAFFFCHPISRPIWEALPLLPYVQFPWRFLGLVVFGSAICAAALFDRLAKSKPLLEVPVFFLGLAAVLLAYFPFYTAATFLVPDGLTSSITQVDGDRVEALRNAGRLLPLDRLITPARIREIGERATSGDDFLPRGVGLKPAMPATELLSATPGKVTRQERLSRNHYRSIVSMTASGTVELQQFWFPGWTAKLDGRPVAIAPAGKAALVSCAVPAGDHALEFKYTSMPQRRIALLVSGLAIVLTVAVASRLGKSR